MSLHRVIAPPPLAFGIRPAPPPKPKEEKKKEEVDKKPNKDGSVKQQKKKDEGKLEIVKEEDEMKSKSKHDTQNGAQGEAAAKADTRKTLNTDASVTSEIDPDTKDTEEADPPPPTLTLLPPVPFKAIRTELAIHPGVAYPPVYSDPRGAYHKYAKANQLEGLTYIDICKDGWLFPQWKDKAEREALARLRGDAEKQRLREVAKAKERSIIRQVPESAERILLELWNDLVEAPAHEVSRWSHFGAHRFYSIS